MDMEKFEQMSECLDRLIDTIENLTVAITGASVDTFKAIRKKYSSDQRLNQIHDQLTDLIDLSKVEDGADDNLEKRYWRLMVLSFFHLACSHPVSQTP